jgi:hypothetical protein
VGPASCPECLSECKSVTASHPEYLAERSEPYSELFGVLFRACSVGYSGLCVCISPIVTSESHSYDAFCSNFRPICCKFAIEKAESVTNRSKYEKKDATFDGGE